MPGPWITEQTLRELLANVYKMDVDELPGRTTVLVKDCNKSAALDITAALTGRGYTIAQIDSWDRREEFNKDLGLFWCLVRGNALGTYNPSMINSLDRRKELTTVQVTTGGVIVLPGGGGVDEDGVALDGGGAVSGGRFDQDSWRFGMDEEF